MSLFLRFAATSDVGRVRRDNQDSGYIGPNLIVVADGVGGAARGDIASSAAVDVLRKLDVPAGNDALSELAATIHLAHDRLAEIVESHPDLDGTSTTVSSAIFDGTHLRVGHVGDSRGYLFRDGALQQLTSDHSLVQSLVDEGRITEDEARVHPHRNLILKAVDSVHEPDPDVFSVPVRAGDRILFCSDGCSGALTDDDMASILAGEPLESVTAALVNAALDAGSSDNVTVVVGVVEEGEPTDAAPIVVGAAALSPHLQIANEATNNLSDADSSVLAKAIDPEAIRYAPQPPPRRAWLRRVATLIIVLAVLGGVGYGGYAYSQTRYFVTADGQDVNIYKGVDFDLPLVKLYTRVESTGFTLDEVGDEFAAKIRSSVDKGSLKAVQAYVLDARCAKLLPPATAANPPLNDLYKIGMRRKNWPLVRGLPSINNVPGVEPILAWSTPMIDPEVLTCEGLR